MLYVETGQLFNYVKRCASLTGIQRLTLVCAKRLPKVLGSEHVCFMAYDAGRRGYVAASATLFASRESLDGEHLDIRSKLWKKVEFTPADTVLLTETWWWPDGIGEAALQLKKAGGARVFRFVHDVIPLAAPQYVGEGFTKKFGHGLIQAAAGANVLLTNSKTSQADLLSVLKRKDVAAPSVKVVPLAHEFETQGFFKRRTSVWQPYTWKLRAQRPGLMRLLEKMRRHPHVVCVGTIEPRKNILNLLKAWQVLASRLGDRTPRLVLAGRWGWNFGDIRSFLKATHHLDGKVEALIGADDDALKALYENCLFTVYLSHYEGWGLPVGESMWLGKPVLASNSTSIPEVGGTLVDYVNPDDKAGIAYALEKLTVDTAHREKRIAALKAAKLRSWDDFTRDLLTAMDVHP